MRAWASCAAAILLHRNRISPYFICDPGRMPEKGRNPVVTRYSLFPRLEAIWTRRAGTFPVERPRIGRHWNYPQRHFPYRQGAIAPGLIGSSDRLVAAPGAKP